MEDAFEYFRNDALDARNYFDPSTSPKAAFHNNQFGGSLGGPIIKDRTFFFVDYEGQRENVGVVSLACVPTLAQISQASANVVAAGGVVSPVGQSLLGFWPHNAANYIPGSTSSDAGCFNGSGNFAPDYTAIAPSFNNLSSFIAKIDHSFNTNNNISGRYFFGDSTQHIPTGSERQWWPASRIRHGYPHACATGVDFLCNSIVSPTKVNEIRFGWNRFAEGFFPQDRNFDPGSIGFCNHVPLLLVLLGGISYHSSFAQRPTGAAGFFSQIGATSGRSTAPCG